MRELAPQAGVMATAAAPYLFAAAALIQATAIAALLAGSSATRRSFCSSLAGLTPSDALQQPRNLIVRDGRDPPSGACFRERVCGLEIIERLTRTAMHLHSQ